MPAWLPNAITFLRVALVPAWWVQAAAAAASEAGSGEEELHRRLALAILVTIGLSDVVDGFLARRFGLVTRFGATLDAAADKLAQVVLFVFFTFFAGDAFTPVPLVFFLLIGARDVVLAAGTLLVRARCGEVAVVHRWHGKLASLLLFFLLVALTADVPAEWARVSLWGLGLLIVASTLAYVRDGWLQWSASPTESELPG